MRPAMHHPSISAVRADALFVSALQRSDDPSTGQVRNAIAAAVHEFGGQGCAEQVAQEFGDHPETAVVRMRWARALAGEACRSCFARCSCVPCEGTHRDASIKQQPGHPAARRTRPTARGAGHQHKARAREHSSASPASSPTEL